MKKEFIQATEFIELTAYRVAKGHYFNSLSHFYEDLQVETGYSVNGLKSIFKKKIVFKNNQITFKEKLEYYEETKSLPNYILNTRKIQDGLYWLKEREYQILIYLDKFKKYIENQNIKNNINSPLYVSIETIEKDLEYTHDEIKYSLKKLKLYFENLRVKEDDYDQRIHKKSRSHTTHLPPRKEWKTIIEAKIVEMTGLDSLKIEKPYYVDEEDMKRLKQLWKKGVERSIRAHAKLKGFIEGQNQKLKKGAEAWQEIKQEAHKSWEKARGKFQIFLCELSEMGIISEIEERKLFKSTNPYNDLENLEQRILVCLRKIRLFYPSIPDNLIVSW